MTIEDRRKFLLNGAAILSLAAIFPSAQPSYATPVRAPLPPGPADPQDKAKLEDIAKYLDTIGPELTNPEKWSSILEVINKVVFVLCLIQHRSLSWPLCFDIDSS